MAVLKEFNSLYELMDAFPDEQSCLDHLKAIRWKNGAFCPYCGHDKVYSFKDGRNHKCAQCRQRFSIKVGTIFEDTKITLRKWFMAIWLITSHKKGIASTTLAKDLKITQKTAWFVLHRLRYAARTKSFAKPLEGIVEADTTFVGGKEKNKHEIDRTPGSQGGANKAVVVGVVEREGDIRAEHVPDTKAKTIHGYVKGNVKKGAFLMTDEDRSFVGMEGHFDVYTVNHGQGEYVRDHVIHTNSIEGAWGLFKRQIFGIHHWVSAKHLSRYLSEMTWRYNRRSSEEGGRVNELLALTKGRLKYKELIA